MLQFSGRVALMALVLGSALALTGCASGPSVQTQEVSTPNESLLAPAQNAMARAARSGWSARAPTLMGSARMRLSTARSIVYTAARQNRDLTSTEKQRVNALVDAVMLDVHAAKAKSALVSTRSQVHALEHNQRSGIGAVEGGETERKALQPGMTQSESKLSSGGTQNNEALPHSRSSVLGSGSGSDEKGQIERPLPDNNGIGG